MDPNYTGLLDQRSLAMSTVKERIAAAIEFHNNGDPIKDSDVTETELVEEIIRLQEFEWMYEDLCK